jgi:peptidyl-prolyl cis-trans isomerase SurA
VRVQHAVWGGIAAALLAGHALAQPAPPTPTGMVLDRVVASVNEEAITLSELQEEGQPVIRKIFQDFVGPERERRVDEAQRRFLDDLVDRRLMYQVAKREGMVASAAEIQGAIEDLKRNNNITSDVQLHAALKAEGLTLEQVRRSIGERLTLGRLITRQVRSTILVSEDELVKYYEAHREEYQRVPEAKIRHLLVALTPDRNDGQARGRAEEAAQKIRSGGNFGEVAAQYSDAPAGGDAELLTVHRGDTAPPIESAAFGNPAGWLSDPIRSEAGWHVIRIEEVRAEPVAPLAEVREVIRERVMQEKFDLKRKEWLANLRARASIQIYATGQELATPMATP